MLEEHIEGTLELILGAQGRVHWVDKLNSEGQLGINMVKVDVERRTFFLAEGMFCIGAQRWEKEPAYYLECGGQCERWWHTHTHTHTLC